VKTGRQLFLASLAIVGLSASTAAQEADPLAEVAGADPLDLSRAVARLGDDAVMDRLREGTSAASRLAAIRATPALAEPERALAELAEIARGRDPDLAPAAALSALTIAGDLDADELVQREADRDLVTRSREAFEALGHDESVRRDIRRVGFMVAERLRSLTAS